MIVAPLQITPGSIVLGTSVFVHKNARIQGVNRYNEILFTPRIVFCDNVTVQQNLHLTCANSIEIGENTAIGANVTITDIHHPYEDINVAIEMQDIICNAVQIGRDCKIYNNSVILPGVNIGDHVTIGANCVVNKNIPSYCVAVGNPVRIVKRYCFEKQLWRKTLVDGSFI